MSILFLVLIVTTYPQQIDMVAVEDTLLISMVESNQVWLYRYESLSLIDETILCNNNNTSIGLTDDDPMLLVAASTAIMWGKGYSDTLYAIDPADLSTIWQTGDLPDGFFPEFQSFRLERWQDPSRSPRLVGHSCTMVTYSSDDQWIFSYSFDSDTSPIAWEDYLYQYHDGGYISDIFLGPVTVSDQPILTALMNNVAPPVGAPPEWPTSWWVEFHVHESDPDSLLDILDVGGGQYLDPPYYPRAYCLGSCSDHAVLLWSDTTGTIYSTEVTGDPLAIDTTEVFPYTVPTNYRRIAASRNPSDPGFLMCYYMDGYIRARYWEDTWYPYEHLIAPSGSTNGIAVSGTPDGYWIAWEDGDEYPSIEWIDRETLTGISADDPGVACPVSLTAIPNPCSSVLSITVTSMEDPVTIDIYDSSGHLIESANTDNSGHLQWNVKEMPSGLYFIRAVQGAGNTTEKVIIIE